MASNEEELAYTAEQVRSLATRLNLRADMLRKLGKELTYLYGCIQSDCLDSAREWRYVSDVAEQAQATLHVVADTLADINIDAQALDELLESVEGVGE